jgi:hypothetical protein
MGALEGAGTRAQECPRHTTCQDTLTFATMHALT